MGSFFGGSSKVTSTTPGYIEDAGKSILGQAEDNAARDYWAAPGPRIAPLTTNEISAYDIAGSTAGEWRKPYNDAYKTVQGGPAISEYKYGGDFNHNDIGMRYDPSKVSTSTFDQSHAERYMNPYIKMAIDPVADEIYRAADRSKNQRNAMAVSRGAFGGSRQALEDTEADRNTQWNIAKLYGGGYNQGFAQSLGAYENEAQRRLSTDTYNEDQALRGFTTNYGIERDNEQRRMATHQMNEQLRQAAYNTNLSGVNASLSKANTLQGIAAGGSSLVNTDVNRLMQTGNMLRGFGQANLDQFKRDWDMQYNMPDIRLQNWSNTLANTPFTANQVTQKPSVFGQLAGAGLSAAGMYLSGGGSFGSLFAGATPALSSSAAAAGVGRSLAF